LTSGQPGVKKEEKVKRLSRDECDVDVSMWHESGD